MVLIERSLPEKIVIISDCRYRTYCKVDVLCAAREYGIRVSLYREIRVELEHANVV